MAKKKTEIRIVCRDAELVPVAEIIPYVNNAKIHSPEQISKLRGSLREYGFVRPLLIDEQGNLISGHGTLEAARAEGMETVPCIRADGMTEAQRRAYIHADNRLAELSSWDKETLALDLEELQGMGVDMVTMGFDITALPTPPREVNEDEYDCTPPVDTRVRAGQVWQLGRHRLMCGDSTREEDVTKLMHGQLADMLLTDPPYNVDYKGSAGKIANDNLPDSDFRKFLTKAFAAAKAHMRGGAAFHIWHSGSEAYNFCGACRDAGLQVHQQLVWVKNNFVLGRQDFQNQHEPCLSGEAPAEDSAFDGGLENCLYGWKEGAAHSWYMNRKQSTVLHFDRPTRSKEHPTMKPILLFNYEMRCNSREGDIILDLFGGSGTTIMAAEQNGRTGYVMEFDPRYVDVIIHRWEALSGEKAVLLDE